MKHRGTEEGAEGAEEEVKGSDPGGERLRFLKRALILQPRMDGAGSGPRIRPMNTRPNEQPAAPDAEALAADFEAFHARFASLFVRSEPREHARQYVRALLGP